MKKNVEIYLENLNNYGNVNISKRNINIEGNGLIKNNLNIKNTLLQKM